MTGVLIVVVALLSIAATAFFVIRSESRKGPACCEGKKCRVGPAHGRGSRRAES